MGPTFKLSLISGQTFLYMMISLVDPAYCTDPLQVANILGEKTFHTPPDFCKIDRVTEHFIGWVFVRSIEGTDNNNNKNQVV